MTRIPFPVVDYEPLFASLARSPLAHWPERIRPAIAAALSPSGHGDLAAWQAILEAMPDVTAAVVDFNSDCLLIGKPEELPAEARDALAGQLMAFHPWRKGPLCLFGIVIDTEWRSDWKWRRVQGGVDLRGKRVLDVGCGNGYYGWRMLGAGADLVIGVDPTLRYVMQYAALARFVGPSKNYVLPLKLEDLPPGRGGFDTVFSMGVLYHRRDPVAHLEHLGAHLDAGGELVIETLVIDGTEGEVLVPKGRYAKMKNVWAIPSTATLCTWLEAAGFEAVTVQDITPTTTEEQRRTEWMRFESLADYLDPKDPTRTIEGYPSPIRAVVTGRKV